MSIASPVSDLDLLNRIFSLIASTSTSHLALCLGTCKKWHSAANCSSLWKKLVTQLWPDGFGGALDTVFVHGWYHAFLTLVDLNSQWRGAIRQRDNSVPFQTLTGAAGAPVRGLTLCGAPFDTRGVRLITTHRSGGDSGVVGSWRRSGDNTPFRRIPEEDQQCPQVSAITMTPAREGSVIFLGTVNGTVLVWSPATETQSEVFRPLPGQSVNNDAITCLACSSLWVAAGTSSGILWAWHRGTREEILKKMELHGHEGAVRALAIEGELLVSGSIDCTARVWRLGTTACGGSQSEGHWPVVQGEWPVAQAQELPSISISNAMGVAKTGNSRGMGERAGDAGTCEGTGDAGKGGGIVAALVLEDHRSLLSWVAIGQGRLLTLTCDGVVACWDLLPQEDTLVAEGGDVFIAQSPARCVAMCSSDVRMTVLIGGEDGNMHLWKGAPRAPIRGWQTMHADSEEAALWSSVEAVALPTCTLGVSGSADSWVRVWDLDSCILLRKIKCQGEGGVSMMVADIEVIAWTNASTAGVELVQIASLLAPLTTVTSCVISGI